MNGKIVGIFLCLSMGGCGLMKDAKQAFDNDIDGDRKSTRLNSVTLESRMPSSA